MNEKEIYEICDMVTERNHAVAIEEATKTIKSLEQEIIRLQKKHERNLKTERAFGAVLGAFGMIAIFAFFIFTYGHLWTVC